MFDTASRLKLRFSTPKGLISVEDLWDLPLTGRTENSANLDDIAKALHKLIETNDVVSFVVKDKTSATRLDQLRFDIVKHIIDVKLAERDAASLAAENKERKQQLLTLIAQKENEQLSSRSVEELRKMAEELK